jgi:hypothetical protein
LTATRISTRVFRYREEWGAPLGLWQHSGFFPEDKGLHFDYGERGLEVKKMFLKAAAVLGLCLCLNSCIPTALAVYGVSRHRTHKSYNEYLASMEKTNQERQSQGLEPQPILSFDEWKKHRKELGKAGEMTAPAPAPAPSSGK